MTMLIDIKAFLTSARIGSFSGAAREINTTPSVITKRVGRLEQEVGVKLFHRSTRNLSLTSEGKRLHPQLQVLVAELDDTIGNFRKSGKELRGHLRVRAPTTVGAEFVGASIARFLAEHRGLSVDLLLIDRSINPLEEGFDVSLGALPQAYAGVEETTLCEYSRVLVASPNYLKERKTPNTPADLAGHDCIAFVLVGLTWNFVGASGLMSVDVQARYTVNDSRILLDAAIEGLGIAVLPEFLAREPLKNGELVEVMPNYPVMPLWFKTLVPSHRARKPEVIALVKHLKKDFEMPPWAPDADEQ